ncbi:MAG TPA: replication-relaxation family protein [Solirubrobacteraceae bacterium]|nr:replication-relaxation family protein [Solirubrobacteraceae bacterium]
MLRFLIWQLLGLLGLAVAIVLASWMLAGGPGMVLRGARHHKQALLDPLGLPGRALRAAPRPLVHGALELAALLLAGGAAAIASRTAARRRREYVRLRIDLYRADRAAAESLVAMFATLHRSLQRRWWRRLLLGQPSLALEVHHDPGGEDKRGACVWFALTCPAGEERNVEAALRGAYPNCCLVAEHRRETAPPQLLRLKKRAAFIGRARVLDRFEQERHPPVNRLVRALAATGERALVQLVLTPAPTLLEHLAAHLYRSRELGTERAGTRSRLGDLELLGGLDVQRRPLSFTELRVLAQSRGAAERIAAELRAGSAENDLVVRGTALRQGRLRTYDGRIARGEGNPLPNWHRGVFSAPELAGLWQLPSGDFATVPVARRAMPVAPAPPGVLRPGSRAGVLTDAYGPISIHPELRRQNVAAPGTVEQGKSSFLVATVAEDLLRERCAVIVLDPKGDAADAALSAVAPSRTCTLLDLAKPTCGFNPLAAEAPADVIADYVVAALKNLFTDADIRASSDRYLRNAIIAVLAFDRRANLWDAARLLSVGEEGYAYRRAVGAKVRGLPELREIAMFFTAELAAQLADARSTTTAKLDAPVNKLARLLNSASIKRVLLNDTLRIDFDRVIAEQEVLVVRGALGAMGAGNTAVVMQLLVGMLDAALARQQDLVPAAERIAVALKIDEAPLVVNRGFAETMALKRSAGLETVACWQSDAQWTDREVRDQLDALFAHRIYFATASARDARSAAALAMSEFSDTIRPGNHLSTLAQPDARLHLPRHHAIVSLATPGGRQPAFIAQTIPMRVDPERIAHHARRQRERGGRPVADLRQPHWEDVAADLSPASGAAVRAEEHPGGSRCVAVRGADVPQLPATAAASFAELIELDRAVSARTHTPPRASVALRPDAVDLAILRLVASYGHVLSSQIHRRLHAGRAPSTTQRRIKKLADAGLLERIQLHRRDGGGVPMCCAITGRGAELLAAGETGERRRGGWGSGGPEESPEASGRASLAGVRRAVHVAGWALALERVLGTACEVLAAGRCALSPPAFTVHGERAAMRADQLRLPGGRVAHDFLHTTSGGERVAVERFDSLRPDAVLAVGPVDVLVERDARLPARGIVGKLERYDHFLSGWSVHTRRYGDRGEAEPLLVFLCRDRVRAREAARSADAVLSACRAYAGDYPFDWEYPGRERIVFASERDAHEGHALVFAVPRLPPAARVLLARGDPAAARATVEPCTLLVEGT